MYGVCGLLHSPTNHYLQMQITGVFISDDLVSVDDELQVGFIQSSLSFQGIRWLVFSNCCSLPWDLIISGLTIFSPFCFVPPLH